MLTRILLGVIGSTIWLVAPSAWAQQGAKDNAKPLIRMPSVDVNQPLPIPILARPQKDRASLADPGLEASLQAAIRPVAAVRNHPAPFVPINLPDPFENVRAGQLRNPPEESPMPPAMPLQKPTR